ncbi:MAG: PQQ-binding-like beta-propeller repeat protein [Bdellovibrionales bacterium]|nr:PQQ-binding-like beta-propeller repeat protein [Bdellovibrionales bacterium]
MADRSWIRVAALAVLFTPLLACGGRNLHRGQSADPEVLLRAWTLPTHGPFEAGERGAEFSNAVLHDQTLIFGSEGIGVVSLYPQWGQVRWVLPLPGGVRSELLAAGDAVYFGGGDGFLYSVSAETGRVNWRYEVRNAVVSKPTLAEGRLFVTASDDTVYGFDAGSGEWLWHYRRRSTPSASIHGASSPLVNGDTVLVGLSDGFLVGLGLQDGKLKWERKLHTGNKFTDVDAHPVKNGSTVYVPSYDGQVYALDARTQEVQWKADAGGSRQVLVDDARVILPSSDGHVYALSKESGKTLWKFELDGGVPTQVVQAGPYLVFGSTYQYLYALESATGRLVYRFNAGHGTGFYGNPTLDASGKRIYVLSGAGNLYALAVKDKERNSRWDATSVRPSRFHFDGDEAF